MAERTVLQSSRFRKAKRSLSEPRQLAIDETVRALIADPLSGEPKVGALTGVRVVKFKAQNLQLLLAYEFNTSLNRIELLDVGPHENFYRDLQRHLDAR